MPIDPSIALNVKGLELQDPLTQYGRMAAIQQAQNQNALAQYQLGAAQRAEAKDIARTNALSQAGNDETAIANALLKAGDLAGYTSFLKSSREANKANVDLVDAKLKQSRGFLETLDPNVPGAAEAYIAWHEANHKDPVLGPVLAARGITAEQSRERIAQALQTPGGLAKLINQSKLGTEKFMEMNKAQLSTKDIGGAVVDRTFEPLTGKITEIDRVQKTMTPSEAKNVALREREVAIQEDKNRREKDPVFQQRMAAAKATGEAIAKGDVAAQQALPQIVSRAEEGARLIDELIGKRDEKGQLVKGAAPHPGFQNAVGATWLPGARFVPGTDAAGFMSRFDQIKGASFLEAFNALKGGGAITEKEGQKGTDAINRMSIATDEKEFVRAAIDLKNVIQRGVENAQKRAAKFGGTSAGVSVAPAAPAVGGAKFLGFE